MPQAARYELLYDQVFPFFLYADSKRGATESLVIQYSMPTLRIQKRIEAVRLSIEKQVRIDVVSPASE